jgi:hypothetical protein
VRQPRLLPAIAGAVCLASLSGCERGLPVEAAEKEMVLRAGDLVEYGYGMEQTEQFEKFAKTRFFDGSSEITYEFETPDSEEEHPLYLNVTMTFEKKTSDARLSQGAEKVGMKYGLKAAGIEAREIKGFYKFGDTSEFYLLEKDGNPVGNMFFARQGKRIYTLVVSGMYFDDAATWKELIEEKLTRFAAHGPD